ncbi:MAG: NAD(P)/FAD-dependent oxidoreductase [Acidobacteriaceae bacterium]
MPQDLSITGNGIAAVCCARLLADAKIPFRHESAAYPRLAAVLLSRQTQTLLQSIFPEDDLFAGYHPIRKRVVLWGENATPVSVPHYAVVAPESDLLDRLWSRTLPLLSPPMLTEENEQQPQFSMITSSASGTHVPGDEISFGQGVADVTRATLKKDADPHACMIEAVADGWIFLLPLGEGVASLISVANSKSVSVMQLLGQSTLIKAQLEDASPPATGTAQFSCAPRIRSSLCNENWLACGSAALAFDPVCGEGVGHAVREAFLATAVIQSMAEGEPLPDLLAHYRSRLQHGFLRHLDLSRSFYASGGKGDFWTSELEQRLQGIAWLHDQIKSEHEVEYQLVDRTLRRRLRSENS